MTDLSTARNGVAGISRTVASIRQRTTSFKHGVRQVRQLADGVQEAYMTTETKVTAARKIIAHASLLPTSFDEAIAWTENLARLDDVADITVLVMQAGQLTASAVQARVDLRNNNRDKVTGSITVPGNVRLVAGINIRLTGMGAFSGE